jgi:hypothetical protein
MFCASRLIFGGTEGVVSCFHVLHSRTRFSWYRGRRVSFVCFALPGTFSAARRASGLDFIFCAPGLIFVDTEDVGSHFLVLCARTRFRRYPWHRLPFSYFALPDSYSAVPRAPGAVFVFCAPELFFDGIEGVRTDFHVFRSRTHFRRCGGRLVQFSYFALPDSFSAFPRKSGPVFKFYAFGPIFDCTEGVRFRFPVLLSWTCFRRCRVRRVPF